MAMENQRRSGVLLVVCLAALAMSMSSEGRELRPTEHGLEFQSNFTESETGEVPEMQAFFDGKKNSTTSSSAARFPLPEAKDPSDEQWWREVTSESKGPGDRRKDRVRRALMVATLVCGTAGVALLVVAAVLFIIQSKKQKYTNPTSK